MPKLFDLLSERSDKDALKKLQRQALSKAPEKRAEKRPEKRESAAAPSPKREQPGRKILVPDFVALDLETTGLEPKTDRVIEIGAIKYIGGVPSGEYVSFVNPRQPVPAQITELTGITGEAVAGAPFFEDVADALVAFIGHYPLCGHQIEFDYNFLNAELKRAGKGQINSQQLDTAVLSRLLLSNLPGYSLANVAKHLAVPQANAHRALDDARVSGMVAGALIPRLGEIPAHTRITMGKFAPPSLLKTILLKSAEAEGAGPAPKREIRISRSYQRISLPQEPVPVDRELIRHCFSETGRLSRLIKEYMYRPSQAQMALAITDALNRQQLCVAEAGTGTGKSMAYLAPAALWACANNARVLVSTHTKNLQDQLFSNDLPVVQSLIDRELRYTVLKGRSNYLCLYRWNRFLWGEIGNISAKERLGILPLIKWAEETVTGDIEEQNQFNRKWFARIWSLVSADSYGCQSRRCPVYGACFLQHARQKALSSHIVVINHALFFSEICSGSSFLGKIGPVIFDEAHHLESCGHRFLRVEIDTNRVNRYIDFMNNLFKTIEYHKALLEKSDLFNTYKTALKHLRRDSTRFLEEITEWAAAKATGASRPDGGADYAVAYRDKPFENFSGLSGFQLVFSEMQDILAALQELSPKDDANESDLFSDASTCMEKTSQLKADLIYLASAVTDDHVFWAEGDRKKNWVKLCGVPLDIGSMLGAIWRENPYGVVFTSATLTVADKIDYFKSKTGLGDDLVERTSFKVFSSPFSSDQMLRCGVGGTLTPDAPGYNEYVANTIIRLLNTFEKNILVLFTANTMLQSVYEILRNSGDFPADALSFAQNISGPRNALLNKFKESKKSVLLGTSSFWEGIDAPGEACEIVLIPRLPFPVPTHPLTQALAAKMEAQSGDSFFGFSVPEAVIKFRQGAGRLIRTASDRGALIVLDSRIIGKSYGRVFCGSLDGEFTAAGSVEEMIDAVAAFFKRK